MKKAWKWLRRILLSALLTIIVSPLILSILLSILMVIAVKTDLFDLRNEAAVAALESTHLSAYTEHTVLDSMTLGDCMTLFTLAEYDNRVDHTDLRAGVMRHAAADDSWHEEPLSPSEYAARIAPEARFLLPASTFDAWFESADALAFFDRETGLFIHNRKGDTPRPGSIHLNGLTIPHNGYVYTMETHGGFHGDGTTYHALIVPAEQRPSLEAQLALHEDWHHQLVTDAEHRTLHHERFYQTLPLYPAEHTDFEWFSFVDTYSRRYPEMGAIDKHAGFFPAALQERGAYMSLNWHCSLYDPDTGLFIYYQFDS